MSRAWTFPLLALLLTAGPAGAQQADDTGVTADPCALSQGVCDGVTEAWHATRELFAAEPGEGLPGLVAAVAEVQPEPAAAWSFPRALEPIVAEAQDVGVNGLVHRIAGAPGPGAPGPAGPGLDAVRVDAPDLRDLAPPVLVVGIAEARPGAVVLLREEDAGVPSGALVGRAGDLAGAVPADPRPVVAQALETLGQLGFLVTLPEAPVLPEPPGAVAPAPQGTAATASALPGRPGPRLADAVPLESPGAPAAQSAPVPAAAAERPGLAALGHVISLLGGPGPLAAVAAVVVGAAMLAAALLVPLYHRLQRDRVLDHGTRARLIAAVKAMPGIHIEELSRLTGCSRSTAVYHLRVLERNAAVRAVPGGKTTHYFPNQGRWDPAEQEQRVLLGSGATRAVAAAVLATPGAPRRALEQAVGLSSSTLSWHLGRLLRLGLVQDQWTPSGRILVPGPRLAELLHPWTRPRSEAVEGPAGAAEASAGPPPGATASS